MHEQGNIKFYASVGGIMEGLGKLSALKKLIVLVTFASLVLATGCSSLIVKRAPGGVPKPAVQTLGRVEFTIPFTRRGGDNGDQFALWLEDPKTGSHFKTLAVTTYTATIGYKKDPGALPTWEQSSGIATMTHQQQKDVNAMLTATPPSGNHTWIWYCDNDAGTEAMPAGDYNYYLESSTNHENHVLYMGSITIGDKEVDSIGLPLSGSTYARAVVGGITAHFIPQGQKSSNDKFVFSAKDGSVK